MPELPDVAAFKKYLDATSLHQKISRVAVRDSRVLRCVSARKFRHVLNGSSFVSSERHGKNLLVELDSGSWLRLHFGMTGYLRYFSVHADEPQHTRALFSFARGFHLAYVCQRMLGCLLLCEGSLDFAKEQGLGPDALNLSLKQFRQIMKGQRGSLKTTLMNQKVIAGLGNIYSDEILFQAGLQPMARVGDLDDKDIGKLHQTMRRVLRTAINHDGDATKFPRSYLIHSRGEGEPCPRCFGQVVREKISQRSTYFCPACQQRP